MKKITLDSKMQFESSITCNCVGVFDVMYLVFQYGSVFLVWDIPIPHALEVIEKNVPPSFDFKNVTISPTAASKQASCVPAALLLV